MYCRGMANTGIFLMSPSNNKYEALIGSDEADTRQFDPPLVNIGAGTDGTIRELALAVKTVIGDAGRSSSI